LLRQGDIENAQAAISQLKAASIAVPAWIYVALIHCLAREHDLDAVLVLAHNLHDQRVDMPSSTWSYLLDLSLQHRHIHLTEWVWYKQVAPLFLIPDATKCRAIIQLAVDSSADNQRANGNRHLELAQNVLAALKNISPETAVSMRRHLFDVLDAAGREPTRMREEAAYRQSMFTLFSGDSMNSYIDPRSALRARPAGKYRGVGRLRRKAIFEGKAVS
jgi:hypothetical protein